jgi:hypothetical protein
LNVSNYEATIRAVYTVKQLINVTYAELYV